MLKIYEYINYGTCRKATKYLDAKKIAYKTIPIRETPPSKSELKLMLKALDGNIKKMLNTSGRDYRALNIKDKLPKMTECQVIDLLAGNGNLIKRPFVLNGKMGWVGFNEGEWKRHLK